MKLLDERGIGTVWSICKEKFALVGHTHNYAGSGSPGGSANSAIGVVDYNQAGKTIQIGYSGTGITGDQIKYIAGYTDGSDNVNAKIKDVSKDALKSWLDLGSLAYSSSSIPTKLSQLNNDKGFVTGSVSGNTVTINGASTTWTNTWRGIQDNLTSSSTSESLSANQGRVLKVLIDNKANSSDLSSYAQKSEAIKDISLVDHGNEHDGYSQLITLEYADGELGHPIEIKNADSRHDGFMSRKDKSKLDGIQYDANNYSLPLAADDTLGGIKLGHPSLDIGNGRVYPLKIDLNQKAYVDIYDAYPDSRGLMSAEDKTKLDGIESGANNYTLPVATATTLGGIKTGFGRKAGVNWEVNVDENGNAYVNIDGLYGERNGRISHIKICDDNITKAYSIYTNKGIDFKPDGTASAKGSIRFPSKSGTFALTSDIPDVSNLCRFNFVNSISDCVNGRINFLFKNASGYVDLSFLNNLEEGTILLIYSPYFGFYITNKDSVWYYNGNEEAPDETMFITEAKLVLAFFYNTYAYVSTFSY